MSAKNIEENTSENRNFLASQNDVEPARSAAAAVTAGEPTGALQAVPERTNITASGSASASPATTTTTMVVDETTGIGLSPSSGGGGPLQKRRSNDGAKRKTRRGKAKRGKRSSSSRPYTKSQWKFQSHHVRIGAAAANKRRAQSLSDHPPLVPYNTNRFLMEDHMPQVLTPSEDEEEFLTKEFSSVYEDARSERLESLSKTQLIQEYLQLEANFEQVTRRFAAKVGGATATREENESAVTAVIEGGGGGGRRLEDRIRELTAENLELRRQLEHASRIGMVLSAKSSPRPHAATCGVERMDSSSGSSDSEDSESDSSSSSSSSSDGSSSSSMSDDDDDDNRGDVEDDRQPLVAMMDGGGVAEGEPNGFHQVNGVLVEEDGLPLENGNGAELNGAVSPLSSHNINSPPPPLVMN